MKIVIETESKEMADLLLMVTDRRESADTDKIIHDITERNIDYLKRKAKEDAKNLEIT